jgi:hypothetical protein
MQGCFTILESYLQYFHTMSHKSDQGHVMQLLIEAIGISLFLSHFGFFQYIENDHFRLK